MFAFPARTFLYCLLVLTWALVIYVLVADGGSWPLIPGAGLAIVATVTLGSFNARWELFTAVISRGPARDGTVALTFDDGPHSSYTPVVLDLLEEAGAKATFFMVGERVRESPEVARMVLERGHQVAHHSDRHHWPVMFSRRAAAEDVARGTDAIEVATGCRPRFYRPPVGLLTPELGDAVREAGMLLAAWSVRAFDGFRGDGESVRRRVGAKVEAGDIVLLHDGRSGIRRAVKPPALDALPGILEDLAARGLRSVTLSDLLSEPPYIDAGARSESKAPAGRSWMPRAVGLTLLVVIILSAHSAVAGPHVASESQPLASASGSTESAIPAAFLQAAEELSRHTTVRARFRQTKNSALFQQDVVRAGLLELRNSDRRLLWAYDGGPELLMANGRFYPVGKPSSEVGAEATAGFRAPGGGPFSDIMEALFFVDVETLARYFRVSGLGDGVFELLPQSPQMRGVFRRVRLVVRGDPVALQEVLLEEGSGDSLHLVFSDVLIGQPLNSARFKTPSERASDEGSGTEAGTPQGPGSR
ncbi:MAG TPA: hypothetical protein DIU15_12275 [Deltaproteobacteria bacterium]|nr:hypothetical protein [Deltaproteobacteria bacterium]HCP46813.1 hypothetical protein [Deltaproteobacteria bacterium]